MKEKVDLTLILGIFTSAVIIWIYLYGQIVDFTTTNPSSLALVYMCLLHYLSFMCLALSFVLLLRRCLEVSLQSYELLRLNKFLLLSESCHRMLFSLWGPMFIFGLTAILSINIFANSRFEFLQEVGGFFVGLILCFGICFFLLRINVFTLLRRVDFKLSFFFFVLFFLHVAFLSIQTAGTRFKIEKEFYKNDDIARFEIKPIGYFFLPHIRSVIANFNDTLNNGYGDAYYLDLGNDTTAIQPIIIVQFHTQVFDFPMKSYFYINKTNK